MRSQAHDPGLRRDDIHAGACAQFDYSLLRRDNVAGIFATHTPI
jgi:hypothetical protein